MADRPRKLSATEREILTTCRDLMAEAAAEPEPPEGDRWARQEWEEAREYGAVYEPRWWFNGGEPLPTKYSTRYLRAIYALMGRDLLEATASEGGRLRWLKLTGAGLKAIAARKRPAAETTESPAEGACASGA